MEPGSLRRSPGAGADARGAGGAGARDESWGALVGSCADHRAWRGSGYCGSIGLFLPLFKESKAHSRTVQLCRCLHRQPVGTTACRPQSSSAPLSSRLPRPGPRSGSSPARHKNATKRPQTPGLASVPGQRPGRSAPLFASAGTRHQLDQPVSHLLKALGVGPGLGHQEQSRRHV